MQFCSECHNMYYLKIQDDEGVIGNTLIYYCRNCGHEDTTLSTTNICVSDIQLRSSEKKYTHIVNEYTKYDPTLPRINTIKCPNQDCESNQQGGGGGKKTSKAESSKAESSKAESSKAESSKAESSKAGPSETAEEKKIRTAEERKIKAAATRKAKASLAKAKLVETIIEEAEQQEQAEQQAEQQEEQAEQHQEEQAEQQQAKQQQAEQSHVGEPNNNREVIYIRYDDTNMKYVYLCVHCDTTWRTDNRL